MSNFQDLTPRDTTSRKFVLSTGFIVLSIIYVVWQNISSFSSASTTTLATTNQASPITISSAQSYKAANDALLQTLSQITNAGTTGTPPATAPKKTPVATPAPVPSTVTPPPPVITPVPQKPAGMYADGSYTGPAADAYYGTVQVKAVVKNGQLADVQFLQYPNTHSYSVYVNSQAMPMLTQEAVQAQSAQVSGVSGATFTSQAFAQSLAAALAKAKN